MLGKRIIPCLDIKDGRTVKGIQFENLIDAGDPVELAKAYSRLGADELVFLDISATNEKRATLAKIAERIAQVLNIPFTVGGGINSIEDVKRLLEAGADKVSVNSSIVKRPDLLNELAAEFGSQCIVAAVDAKCIEGTWLVHTHGGKKATDIQLYDWVIELEKRGAGEILFTSMNNDGTKSGFANDALNYVSEHCNIPIIASGGAGTMQHFLDAFKLGKVDAALAASVFHFEEIEIKKLKEFLNNHNIPIRLT